MSPNKRSYRRPNPAVGSAHWQPLAPMRWGATPLLVVLLTVVLLKVSLYMAPTVSAHSGGLSLAYVVGGGAQRDELVAVDIGKQAGQGTVTARIPIGGGPAGVALSIDSRFAYVTQSAANSLAIVNARDQRVVDHMPLGRQPTALLFDPVASFNLLLVSESGDDTVAMLNADTR